MRASLHCASLPWASWRTERTWKVILVWVSVITVSAHRQVLAGRAMAWQAEGNQRREQHERAGDPQARLQPVGLEHPAGKQRADQPTQRVGHVVEAHVQRHAVLLGVADDQVA